MIGRLAAGEHRAWYLLLTAGAALGLAVYVLVCVRWPYVPCRWCTGTARRRQPGSRRAFRLCPRCDRTGRRRRAGRWALDGFRGRR